MFACCQKEHQFVLTFVSIRQLWHLPRRWTKMLS